VVCLDSACAAGSAHRKQLRVGDRPLALSTWCSRESGQLAPVNFDSRASGPRWQAATAATGFDDWCTITVADSTGSGPRSPRPALDLVLDPRLHAD